MQSNIRILTHNATLNVIYIFQSHSVKWLPAFVYAVMCILTVILLAFIPETNGVELPQTMEELADWYRGNKFEMKIGKNVHVKKKAKTEEKPL